MLCLRNNNNKASVSLYKHAVQGCQLMAVRCTKSGWPTSGENGSYWFSLSGSVTAEL